MISEATRRRVAFFREHAGYIVGQQLQGALQLARAEEQVEGGNYRYLWKPDYDDEPEDGVELSEVCVLQRCDGCDDYGQDVWETVEALGGIWDADDDYRRVVEAELALGLELGGDHD